MIFDTHAHYDDVQFDDDREQLLQAMRENGIGRIVNVSSDTDSWEKVVALADTYLLFMEQLACIRTRWDS